MKARFVIVSFLMLFLSTVIRAQSAPDLSGTWVPTSDVNTAPPPPPPPPPVTPEGPPPPPPPPPPPRMLSMTFTQTPMQLTIDRRMEAAGAETSDTATYKLDGSEATRTMGVLLFRTRAGWQGDVLVMSSAVFADGNAVGHLVERYTLVDGKLVVEATRTSPAGTFTSRTVHARKQ